MRYSHQSHLRPTSSLASIAIAMSSLASYRSYLMWRPSEYLRFCYAIICGIFFKVAIDLSLFPYFEPVLPAPALWEEAILLVDALDHNEAMMPEEATLSTTIISQDTSNTSANAGCESSYSTVLFYAVPMIQQLRDGLRIAIDHLSCCLFIVCGNG
ncbi:hypothetical protein CNYM01_06230 [Colletotrichum nymphaeae SA-01]|uniref:Uncharacterized protein n=1 Tax=Colletotrichum nymphaeae SA-01 TaxID=1460502 RepID=A0A135SVS3_9PEZI|nr:hypothetical protein CNYM01_06230 [Colletotrichum nymphaeae SA-01]